MSDAADFPRPEDEPPMVLPVRRPGPPAPRGRPTPPPPARGSSGCLLVAVLLLSLAANAVLLVAVCMSNMSSFGGGSDSYGVILTEKHWGNSESASDKVAVVRVEGILMDELMGYAHAQIDKAAKDPRVKAVVLRVNSPGGSVTASDELHKRLTELKNGTSPRYSSKGKPLVVSMGPMAASGGYYIAMPGEHIFVEPTTTTGSIGVYASMPNLKEFGDKYGVKMVLIKAGDVKASGSMFQNMSPQERQTWQDMVDDMYGRFIKIVEDGRPKLKGKLTSPLFTKQIPVYDEKGNPIPDKTVPYTRKIADGGGYTAAEALKYGLADQEGRLEDAAKHAASLAKLTDYEIVVYNRPPTFLDLMGASGKMQSPFDPAKLAAAATPRLWYLTPNAEIAGMFAAMGAE